MEITNKGDAFKDPSIFELSRHDLAAKVVEKSVKEVYPKFGGDGRGMPDEVFFTDNIFPMGSVGSIMVTTVIDIMGSDEQRKEWLTGIKNTSIITTYAQTELAHGSDVQNLQLLAVFDTKTQEFEFHTPNVGAIKWWPGDLGVFANYALVYARLVSEGHDYGVKPFFFAIRDPETHKPYPGVEMGDIGPKLGYNDKDNGFLKFTKFRVPKKALLARFLKLDEKGKLTKIGNEKIIYAGMMAARTAVCVGSHSKLLKACLISTRYSLVRQ